MFKSLVKSMIKLGIHYDTIILGVYIWFRLCYNFIMMIRKERANDQATSLYFQERHERAMNREDEK